MNKTEDMFSLTGSEYLKCLIDREINLKDSRLTEIQIPRYFKKTPISLKKETYPGQIRSIITPISEHVEKLGYSANIFTTLYEGLLNAFQHGNKYDENKKIILSTSIKPKELEFIISDQGEKIHPKFSRFILEQRQKNSTNSFLNWYNFSEEIKPDINNGTGTSFMHAYMDEIKYFKSKELGGVSLYLYKKQ
ncbi:MAG: ATP-binding protein [Candidatus Woesearchaeota archaeon]|jgi:anti-sigma regulatory factor (Ser/Thr protein kinase)|nr:ATP-binding protein [Candidatus Woesearchaeota archaeon]